VPLSQGELGTSGRLGDTPLKQGCQLPSREGIGGSSKSMQKQLENWYPKKSIYSSDGTLCMIFFEYLALQLQ